MCVTSMVMDHYNDRWRRRVDPDPGFIQDWPDIFQPHVPRIPQREIEEFRELLNRAREYDKRMHEPECELETKKQKLIDLAKQLGVEISFT